MERVYLVRCNQYDPPTIAAGIRSAANGLGVALPQGQPALLHPACPWAHPRFAPHAFTHPAVIEGVALALSANPLTIATNSIPDFPTRYSYRQAGYVQLAQRLHAKLVALDEAATRTVALRPDSVVDKEAALPKVILEAAFTVALPKLTGSTFIPFAGAIRHHQSLLQQQAQTQGHHRLPDKMVDLLAATPPKLIVVDAIQAAHDGGELSGKPVDLGVLIVGTNPVAVDAVCALAYGLTAQEVQYLQLAAERGYGPADLSQIELRGDLTLDALSALGQGIRHVDPNPENYPLPAQVKVLRSPKAELAGTAGGLTEVFLLFEHGGMPWSKARETVLVLGPVPTVPAGKSDVATIIFLDDTSRADEYTGYSRVIRLRGRDMPLSTLLNDVPYAMQVGNLRNALGGEMVTASFAAKVAKLVKGR
jgi:uncharacterized protein (DUF362 family)